ncbi:MAG TPA: hypothetical protein PKX92_09295 [Edaphocola sp.]|nr:hypothetical protein [Edaphocola sp.]
MLKIFKTQNPYSIILLLIITLVIKIPLLSGLPMPKVEEYQVLWKIILNGFFKIFGTNVYFFYFLAIINIFLQGIYLNYIANKYHLFSSRTYLPAYTFIIVSSLNPRWSLFSVEIINTWLLLLLLNNVFRTYNDPNIRKTLFNVGFLVSCLILLDLPNFWFFFFIAFSITLLRNYIFSEWMVTLLGLFIPFYLLVSISYLTDDLYLISKIFSTKFGWNFDFNTKRTIILSVIGFFTFLGILIHTKDYGKMLFQIKKLWGVIFLLLFLTIISTVGIFQQGFSIWMVCLIPTTLFINKVWLIKKPKWMPEFFNFILLAAVVYLNWIMV